MTKKLTTKQELFIREYLVDANATQAAIRAGYSKRTARQAGAENLSKPVIQAEINRLLGERYEALGITTEKILAELAKVGFHQVPDIKDTSKVRALELMGKHLDLWNKKDEGSQVNIQINMTEKDMKLL